MKLTDLLESMEYTCLQGEVDVEISSLVYDSRKVQPGSVFVCICGAVVDGHSFAPQVIEKGASVLVVEKEVTAPEGVTLIQVDNTRTALACLSAAYFGYPAKELVTIGVTGTKGKTTTTYMIRSILEHAGISTGLIGTIETIIGEEHIPAANTTPESYVVQETFRKMADFGCKVVVMEVSSQGLMLDRVGGFTFDYGLYTNLEPDHIGPNEHSSFEEYLQCKAKLFRQCKHGILNRDDKHMDEILQGHTCTVETYGFAKEADLRADGMQLLQKQGNLGVSFQTNGKLTQIYELGIPGEFNVHNALAALAVCNHFDLSEELLQEALFAVRVRGRVEPVRVSDRFSVMIDYAHNAMSLESLLTTLRAYQPKRLVCVFGCGGNRSKLRRYDMGEVSSRLADLTVITSDNPRNEEPADIMQDILTGVKKADGEYVMIEDRQEAIDYCLAHAKDGDVIIVAGKGHEDYQEIKGVKYHMDDRELIQNAAKKLL